jgi:hypothetical protein
LPRVVVVGPRHLRGERVLCDAEVKPLTEKMVYSMVRRRAQAVQVKPEVRILGYLLCSHLSMRGCLCSRSRNSLGISD